ncbi:hypothetical protein B0H19DRAFT_1247786 [Mycena capillaripes]|nr:hypothetical protein B0H19DRAFT_1247786 [Mycena capillaripes]
MYTDEFELASSPAAGVAVPMPSEAPVSAAPVEITGHALRPREGVSSAGVVLVLEVLPPAAVFPSSLPLSPPPLSHPHSHSGPCSAPSGENASRLKKIAQALVAIQPCAIRRPSLVVVISSSFVDITMPPGVPLVAAAAAFAHHTDPGSASVPRSVPSSRRSAACEWRETQTWARGCA